jgi:putative tryptophan/tyrosine transport system substrate-binding protein
VIDRRTFLAGTGAVLLAAPLAAEGQQAGKVYRVGILSPARRPSSADPGTGTPNSVPMALRELGYVEGQNLVVERRFAEGKIDRLSGLARDLVGLRVDVIVAVSAGAVQAAKEATTTIPIVMGFTSDPVGRGFVASLARPGGNITGVALAPETELASKRLALIKEAVPRVPRIAVLTTDEPASKSQVEKARQAAPSLGVKLLVVEVRDAAYDRAFATMMTEGAGALFVVASPGLSLDRRRILELAAKHRIPAIYDWRENADEGGLMAYGSSNAALSRRVAEYVDKILKGAKPADLPVEQPMKFELVINLKTAKALGLTIPPSVLGRADEVIQ